MTGGGTFVISLDFELLWGVRDKRTIADYGANILGVRRAIPAMLDLFEARNIPATWATVGFLFCADKAELIASFRDCCPPTRTGGCRPTTISPISAATKSPIPIATGYRCCGRSRRGHARKSPATRSRTSIAWKRAAASMHSAPTWRVPCRRRGAATLRLTSIVFPRNQMAPDYLKVCARWASPRFAATNTLRSTPRGGDSEQRPLIRAGRLLDSYLPLTGANAHAPRLVEGMVDVPASRFLRPARGRGVLERLRLKRITSAMETAARQGLVFHLWWHPHNFGVGTEITLHS